LALRLRFKPLYHFLKLGICRRVDRHNCGWDNPLEAWSTLQPTVLIATTARWFPTARLAVALANAGFTVDAVCPVRHPISKTGSVRRIYKYQGLNAVTSFAEAIVAAKPDLVVPGDDLSTQNLYALYAQEGRKGKAGAATCALIERSLGAAENFTVPYARTRFIELAEEAGVRVPRTEVINSVSDLKSWVVRANLPVVLKSDASSGGDGVRVVHTLEEAEHALRILQAPPLLARAAKRALIDRDVNLVWPTLFRRRSIVNAQTFVAGREATTAVACWKGEVLAALHFEVVNKGVSSGPATVLRLIENTEMSSAAAKMVRRLNLSGLNGFDFMLESQTGNAYLIEINPRSTQVGHLTLGPGRDIPAALYSAVTGQVVRPAPKITVDDTIALFPQEWIRDSASTFLQSAYHDVPWDKPELIRACVSIRKKEQAWYSQQNRLQEFSVARMPRV
jgi:carbamoyl-phosphate synthase L subunit-like protein